MLSKRIIDEINTSDGSIGVCLPDGRKLPNADVKNEVIFRTQKALNETLSNPEMGFTQAYVDGDIEIRGSLEDILIAGMKYLNKHEGNKSLPYLLFKFLDRLRSIDKTKEKKNITYHYDLGNDFYKMWLDSSMTYSCAFFDDSNESLEKAQENKRRIIFDKLQLKDGDRLLDIGCGWGSILLEAAKLYRLKAVGITLSENQYRYVKEQIEKQDLRGNVDVRLVHYADMSELKGRFNKIVSVGMFEHVGKNRLRLFFKKVNDAMDEDGLFLLHTIGKVHTEETGKWIRTFIFPGGYIPSLPETINAFKGYNFNLIDIDDWRLHYYLTLKDWQRRFNSKSREIEEKYGERFVRMWNLYLIGSAVSFYIASNHVFEILLSKGVLNNYPNIERKFLKSLV